MSQRYTNTRSLQKKRRSQQFDQLTNSLCETKEANKRDPTAANSAKLLHLCNALRDLLLYTNEKKVKRYALCNKTVSYLARCIKCKTAAARIPFLKYPRDNLKVYDPSLIAEVFKNVYFDLYNLQHDPSTPQPTEHQINKFLDNFSLPSLSNEHRIHLSRSFTTTEILKVIRDPLWPKAPRIDGFPNEYYIKCGNFLTFHLVNIFNEVLNGGQFLK